MKNWKNVIVTDIVIAVHVKSKAGKVVHNDRPSHGLILNDAKSYRRYRFSSGATLEARAGALFYLPKGSTYQVEDVCEGDCFAINFQAEGLPLTEPFARYLRDVSALEKTFRAACRSWKEQRDEAAMIARHCVYEGMLTGLRESEKTYLPAQKSELLAPAEEILQKRYTDPALQIADLAAACCISDAYFRRLFREKNGVSPHELLAPPYHVRNAAFG